MKTAWRAQAQAAWRQLHAGIRLSWGGLQATEFVADDPETTVIEFSVTPDFARDVGRVTGGRLLFSEGKCIAVFKERAAEVRVPRAAALEDPVRDLVGVLSAVVPAPVSALACIESALA